MGITIQEWTNALRSGNYKQGKNYLRNATDEFCCLGVLCDLADPSKWERTTSDERHEVYAWGAEASTQLIHNEDLELAIGLNGMVSNTWGSFTIQDVLAQHNDNGATFAEIADMIDAGLDKLLPLPVPPLKEEQNLADFTQV
jgi:hypothetical protein